MLWHKIIGSSSAAQTLAFVGAQSRNIELPAGSFSITNLTGGLATTPSAGDLIIVVIRQQESNSTNLSFVISTSGYTSVADLYANGTYDTNLGIFYKRLTEAETSISFVGSSEVDASITIYVWRNTNSTSPLDATTQTTTGTDGGRPDAPSITTVTNNSVVIAIGVASGGGVVGSPTRLSSFTAPSGMENFVTTGVELAKTGIASILRPTAGAYDPPTFGGGSTDTQTSRAAATLALRPA